MAHVLSGFFKRCRLDGDAELGERLVVIFPFTNPWSLKFMEMLAYLLLQLYQEKCPEPC